MGCGGSGTGGTGGSGGSASDSASSASSSTSSSSSSGGGGCARGLVRCGDTCVDIAANDANCGACGQACDAGTLCVHRTCVKGDLYCTDAGGIGTSCDGQCLLTNESLDHCGGCGTACDATSTCTKGTCTAWQGDGTSCASPIVLETAGNFSTDFWFVDGGAPLVLSCGALDPRPTVTFRWTSDKTKPSFKFRVDGNPADDLVIEAFSGAPCGPSTSLGCNNDESSTKLTPELELAVESGKTYYIVVGSFAAQAPSGRFSLHIDD
ncbi:Tryptophan synthase alpha chain [Minicystis rosea]|nr:Tryptophan synthase alpha chain [Minicystis rosea]